ncbi:hypothetical protein PPERSA_08568 [Pseudocohnilembus persalinus]|uniref:DUF676 domain-containing protein n=1 Tax=Pseudocohnilembus persalinus TaxID=266149 RepID=A0A0V0R7G3_PSEPJ|nr:hypothetical protein PPERSA_08568 [Pseudocohnilembus persalinus]|eukprot:KRX10165.1 hypothetical protein PPERSA_08568 [Pseudocohnilembus persalinus]
MKFKTNLNFLIFLKSYRSIDYLSFQEGLFHLRFQIYLVNQKKQTVKYAVPVKVVDLIKNYPDYYKKPANYDENSEELQQPNSQFSTQVHLNSNKKESKGLWIPAHILDQSYSYCTKTFHLKNWTDEELIQLNEHCQFILELEEFPINSDTQVFLDCELMFHDLRHEKDKANAKFKCVSVYKSQIHLDNILSEPMNEYVPVIFDEDHFNIANITLHCVPSDICSINQKQIRELQLSEKSNILQEQQIQSPYKYMNELDKFYMEYVLKFRQSYEKFAQNYTDCVTGYLKEKKKKEIDPLWEYKPHSLPPMIFKKLLAEAQQNQMQIFMKQGKSSVAQLSQQDQQYSTSSYQQQHSNYSQQNKQMEILYKDSFLAIIEEIEKIKALHKQLLEHYIVFLRYGGSYITRKLVKGNQPQPSLYNQQNKFHLFIFVHGFQGNAYDMRLLKNHISVLYPEALLLLSVENEGKTDEDISSLGKNLADEINNFIFKWSPGSTLGRISFICHSLGGLIGRACLPYLQQEHQDKMFSFISLGVPHLGLGLSDKSLINFGMFWLKMWKNSEALKQICMEDKKKSYEETFLYQLSLQPGLSWFRNVVLLNSSQDHYIPYESARIEKMNNKSDKQYKNYHNNSFNNKYYQQQVNLDTQQNG